MKSKHFLSEYSEVTLPISLTDDDRLYLQRASIIHENTPWEKRLYVDELKHGVRFKTVSYVGTIELSSCTIHIHPKFNKGFHDVMRMIAFTEQIPFTLTHSNQSSFAKSDLFVLLAEQFIHMCQPLLLKTKKDYVTYTEDLRSVRGRIQMLDTARKHFMLPKGVVCEFDELTTNILENQILLTILRIIYRHHQFRKHRQLARLISEFENICDSYEGIALPTFNYNRMNHQYEAAHKLGKLIFEGMFINQFTGKEQSYMTVLIDMNELFEKFVVTLLQKHLPQDYEVAYGKRITDAIISEQKSYRHIIPDIVVKDKQSGTTHVIDTKYKFYDSKRIATPDIYQLSFYAQYFQENGPYRSSIIHPVFDGYTERTFIVETNPARLPGEIIIRGVKIEDLLKLIEGKQHLQLNKKALELL